jgi:pantetheine-phosphate adenylyltransferase
MTKACCPGSFDPITNGHLDVIERAVKLFDELVIAISADPSDLSKRPLFNLEERTELIKEAAGHVQGLSVVSFQGLLVDLCRDVQADCVVKGIRAVSDFDYEMKQAHMNARMGVETVFLPTSPEYSYISSSLIKEVVSLGGDISGLVPVVVEKRLKEKLGP